MAIRQGTNYRIQLNQNILNKYKPAEAYAIYKNTGNAKGIDFLAFNNTNGNFAIDSRNVKVVTDILIATGIQANFINTFEYDDYKATPQTPQTPRPPQTQNPTPAIQPPVSANYNPNDYVEYPVRSGEYAFMIAQKFSGNPANWTKIIRKSNSVFLNSQEASSLKVNEILLLPKTWNADKSLVTTTTTNDPNNPAKKKDDDLLFFGAVGYGIYKVLI